MIGHQQIIDLRRSGKKPSCVFVDYGYPVPKRLVSEISHPENALRYGLYPTVFIEEEEVPDVRFLSGCNIIFTCDYSTCEVRRIVEKIILVQPRKLLFTTLKTDHLGIWEDGKWAV